MGTQHSSIERIMDIGIGACLNVTHYINGISFSERYQIGGLVGTGQFAEVYLCKEYESGRSSAMKITYSSYEVPLEKILEEVEIMKILRNHPNIVRLIDYNVEHIDAEKYEVKMVLDLCTGGDLYQYVLSHGALEEKLVQRIMINLLDALSYIHENGIIHRDLKPENILIDNNFVCKIADFGLAKRSSTSSNTQPRSKSLCGSDFYLAPELVKQQEYGAEIDIWSIGVLCYVCLCGGLPFHDNKSFDLYHKIVERGVNNFLFAQPAWRNVSLIAQHFVQWLLETDPKKRPTAEAALNHRWLRCTSNLIVPTASIKTNISYNPSELGTSNSAISLPSRHITKGNLVIASTSINSTNPHQSSENWDCNSAKMIRMNDNTIWRQDS
ncbi:protein kinase domain-containing protein [Cryptosporidium andersoni]|uniref:Protein kinase domain-containing protein n=1 Tax=Cryptosporidium andersoni TaxID=117008 RepID=A0A1J4MI14_9CRYT|nr:protein kinase domain-containing protein [Cryptosporidium andersoni]